jgi:hypothetical protein
MLQKWRERRLRIDKKQANLSLLLLLVIPIPYTFVHEFGHAIACWAEGYTVTDLGLGYTTCSIEREDLLFYASGGLFASMIALVPLGLKMVRLNKGIVVVLLTLSIYNVYNVVIETLSFGTYSTMVGSWNLGYGLANALMFLGIYLGLFFMFLTRTR